MTKPLAAWVLTLGLFFLAPGVAKADALGFGFSFGSDRKGRFSEYRHREGGFSGNSDEVHSCPGGPRYEPSRRVCGSEHSPQPNACGGGHWTTHVVCRNVWVFDCRGGHWETRTEVVREWVND